MAGLALCSGSVLGQQGDSAGKVAEVTYPIVTTAHIRPKILNSKAWKDLNPKWVELSTTVTGPEYKQGNGWVMIPGLNGGEIVNTVATKESTTLYINTANKESRERVQVIMDGNEIYARQFNIVPYGTYVNMPMVVTFSVPKPFQDNAFAEAIYQGMNDNLHRMKTAPSGVPTEQAIIDGELDARDIFRVYHISRGISKDRQAFWDHLVETRYPNASDMEKQALEKTGLIITTTDLVNYGAIGNGGSSCLSPTFKAGAVHITGGTLAGIERYYYALATKRTKQQATALVKEIELNCEENLKDAAELQKKALEAAIKATKNMTEKKILTAALRDWEKILPQIPAIAKNKPRTVLIVAAMSPSPSEN